MAREHRKVAVVTGAAGGLGRALAVELGRSGCALALVDLDEAGLAETRAALEAPAAAPCTVHIADVGDRLRMEQLARSVVTAHGGVDILANNAGVNLTERFEDLPLDSVDWLFATNFFGVLHGCVYFLPHLIASRGQILNVSSMAAFIGMPTQSIYCASKAAVAAMSEAMRMELGRHGVGVTIAYPGALRTNLLRRGRFGDGQLKEDLVRMGERLPTPEATARKIVRALHRNHRRVVIRPEAHLLDWLTRMVPGLIHWLLARVFRGRLAGLDRDKAPRP